VLSNYGLSFKEEDAKQTIDVFINQCVCFVAEEDGEIISILAGGIIPYFFDHSILGFNESFWYSLKTGHGVGTKLLEHVESFLKDNGVTMMTMANMAHNEKVFERFYGRKGYKKMEIHWIKKLR
jgi:GNAT superfamily N-acetyltransferase